ncbi:hypothetical protein ACP4OV_029668 [Aristida adscensionis]
MPGTILALYHPASPSLSRRLLPSRQVPTRRTSAALLFQSKSPTQNPEPAERERKPTAMANPVLENLIFAAAIDELRGRLGDVGMFQDLLDGVRADIAENAAALAEAVAQRALACRRLGEALADAAARRAPPEPEPGKGDVAEALEVELLDDPEVDARRAEYAAEYAEAVARVALLRELHRVMVQALVQPCSYSWPAPPPSSSPAPRSSSACTSLPPPRTRSRSPRRGGAVGPGTASLLRICVLVLCLLFGLCG